MQSADLSRLPSERAAIEVGFEQMNSIVHPYELPVRAHPTHHSLTDSLYEFLHHGFVLCATPGPIEDCNRRQIFQQPL